MIPAGEGLGLLALVNDIASKTRNLNQGEVTACSDNKHVLNHVENYFKKQRQRTVEAGATIEGIRQVTKQAHVSIKFEHAKPNPKMDKTFRQQPEQMLMKECDERSKEKRKVLTSSIEKDNVETIGPFTPVLNKGLRGKNVQTLIREIYVKQHEIRVVKDKHSETQKWIDVNARNCFYEGTCAGSLKCSIGHNHYDESMRLTKTQCPKDAQDAIRQNHGKMSQHAQTLMI